MDAVGFLQFLVSSLVKNKDAIVIEQKEDELGILLTLQVHAEDMGTIIGKEGKTISAIRTMLRVLGSKNDQRINLKVLG